MLSCHFLQPHVSPTPLLFINKFNLTCANTYPNHSYFTHSGDGCVVTTGWWPQANGAEKRLRLESTGSTGCGIGNPQSFIPILHVALSCYWKWYIYLRMSLSPPAQKDIHSAKPIMLTSWWCVQLRSSTGWYTFNMLHGSVGNAAVALTSFAVCAFHCTRCDANKYCFCFYFLVRLIVIIIILFSFFTYFHFILFLLLLFKVAWAGDIWARACCAIRNESLQNIYKCMRSFQHPLERNEHETKHKWHCFLYIRLRDVHLTNSMHWLHRAHLHKRSAIVLTITRHRCRNEFELYENTEKMKQISSKHDELPYCHFAFSIQFLW